ncbi:cupin domain-containing protein [Sinorhizobium americanum]|uniref:cupin domain-containing protein n=1 Tax=Sinorhizobium americanum TaxID=194963 RepID=UPI0026C6D41B
MLVAFRFEEGGIRPLHSHLNSQVSYVAEGTFDVTVDGETVRLGREAVSSSRRTSFMGSWLLLRVF